ncbi:contractile injection system tape measure protein [Ulvibacter antarcticus]|uniref:Uncharacterized protein n=1 Tax=Ulvibacter antarcticus TaxID=442714 RepID=A0A3L9Z0B4_9FLAO|nr:contractile injection system tape measure protein [Ulvibacter antarcticus]RMA64809.1 hypothetical protein BXY75_1691 [Ulvibacter antarcticus]
MNDSISIKSAGLVLIQSFFPMLFERLGLTQDNAFINKENQMDACRYLQYLATTDANVEESYLPLNKVLSGLSVNDPVFPDLDLIQADKDLMEGLIQAAIGHWTAIGETSNLGFRGNWLVRDGILTELEDRWELTVEKKAYDLLISKAPFAFSIIKFPWMQKPIHVNWPY